MYEISLATAWRQVRISIKKNFGIADEIHTNHFIGLKGREKIMAPLPI